MKRKIYQQLLDWKTSGTSKPLMVIGARQIGKTYTIEQFGQAEFPHMLVFNLTDRDDVVELFARDVPTQRKFELLELLVEHPIDYENTLLFFDEVQESEELIEALKFVAEAQVDYHVICAGSLLGVKLKRFGRSFPVGKVELLDMFPMDFEEYLLACGQGPLIEHIRECFLSDQQMVAPLHEKCLDFLRRYLCVGGMPEAVGNLLAGNNDVLRFNRSLIEDIQRSYLSDMSKYVKSPQEAARIEGAYRSIPSQLGNNSHKFQYSRIERSAREREYGSALSWLISSGMVYECHAVSKALTPLRGFASPDTFKLFLNDCGLLCGLLELRFSLIMLDEAFSYKGVLIENYVASQLAAQKATLHYWRSDNNAEVDFLIDAEEGIIPLEVKAGTNKKTPSLRVFLEKNRVPYSIRLTSRNFGFANEIKSVPLYASFCIPGLLGDSAVRRHEGAVGR
jgi:predicted AAA+ superfamily ATPase